MREISLSNGTIAIVDDGDFDVLCKYRWHSNSNGYALRNGIDANGRRIKIIMHRQILGLIRGDGKFVDHINMNRIDNRRTNLRICTMSENLCNRPAPSNNKSGFKGVHFEERSKLWAANIRKNGVRIRIGGFKEIVDAISAYNAAALLIHGEFARTNAPDSTKQGGYDAKDQNEADII